MRSSDWSSDVCSSDLDEWRALAPKRTGAVAARERESSVTTPFGPGRAGTVLSRGPGDPEIAGSGKGGHRGGQTVGTGGGTEDRALRARCPGQTRIVALTTSSGSGKAGSGRPGECRTQQ